jgi:hypothetical protein
VTAAVNRPPHDPKSTPALLTVLEMNSRDRVFRTNRGAAVVLAAHTAAPFPDAISVCTQPRAGGASKTAVSSGQKPNPITVHLGSVCDRHPGGEETAVLSGHIAQAGRSRRAPRAHDSSHGVYPGKRRRRLQRCAKHRGGGASTARPAILDLSLRGRS